MSNEKGEPRRGDLNTYHKLINSQTRKRYAKGKAEKEDMNKKESLDPSDVEARLKTHNQGRSPHTSKYKPWNIVTYIAFSNESKAAEFEKYLKSGSGRAFANKRFWE